MRYTESMTNTEHGIDVPRYTNGCSAAFNNYSGMAPADRMALAKANIVAMEAAHKAAKGRMHYTLSEREHCDGCSICKPEVTTANLEWAVSSTGEDVAFIRFAGHSNSRCSRRATPAEIAAAK